MTRVSIEEALNGSEVVMGFEHCGVTVIQVWYGGTFTLVYREIGTEGSWQEVGVWSISDDKGRAVSSEKIKKHMEMWFNNEIEEGGI